MQESEMAAAMRQAFEMASGALSSAALKEAGSRVARRGSKASPRRPHATKTCAGRR
jgi:hypothetical protein